MRRRPGGTETDRHTPLGAAGEDIAVGALQSAGYRVEDRNVRTRFGEIDVLARRGRTWIAVEVKTRRSDPAPERSVDEEQLRRVAAALRALAPHLRPRPRWLRIDVVAVRLLEPGAPEVLHLPGTRTPAPAARR